jgi:hypothetical protein
MVGPRSSARRLRRLELNLLLDAGGQRHEFHFRMPLLGDRVALEAFELRDDESCGYHFQALGDPQGDLFALMAQLQDFV